MGIDNSPANKSQKLNLSLDLRYICLLLLGIIIAMVLLWRPWEIGANANDRTITVTGQATVKAEPDEYVFYPSYTFDNSDKQVALTQTSMKSDEIIAKLKTLGVKDSQIKTNTYGGEKYRALSPEPTPGGETTDISYNLQLTVNVTTRDQAQKVQDYLTSTSPTGAVSPQPTFSNDKRKSLENKARDEATKEARAKADQSAKNLGFSVGRVKSVDDGSGFGIMPYDAVQGSAEKDSLSISPALVVQPGENDLNYSVTVTYYVK